MFSSPKSFSKNISPVSNFPISSMIANSCFQKASKEGAAFSPLTLISPSGVNSKIT